MEVTCFVEVSRGSRNKYEYDAKRGAFRLDRHVFSSVVYPADYGFVEDTLMDGERHLDALILVSEPTFPGCLVDARPIGIFQMRDEEGVDDKVLCVPLNDYEWQDVKELDDISARMRDEIAHFFSVYKDLEPDRVTAIEGWADRETAEREIADAQRRFAERRP